MREAIIAVILAGLLLLMVPTAVSAASGISVTDKIGDGEWIGDTWQVEIFPGETKSTTVTLYNSSTSPLEVWVTVSPDSLDNGNVTFGLEGTHSIMHWKSSFKVTLSVEASGSATPGTYETELTIKAEIPPARARPKPSEPVVDEPEVEEPEVVEPEEPEEPVEPTKPKPEEPVIEEPEPTEPEEVIEPEEPEELEPTLVEEPPKGWWHPLYILPIGLALIVLCLAIWRRRRRRKQS